MDPLRQEGDLLEEHPADVTCPIRNVGIRIIEDPFQARHIKMPSEESDINTIYMRSPRFAGMTSPAPPHGSSPLAIPRHA